MYTVSILTLDLLLLSFNGFHLIWLIVHTTSLYLIIVLILLLYTQVFLKLQLLALCFSPCILSLCLPLLTHTPSYIIHLLMTYNYRCLLPATKYQSFFIYAVMHRWCRSLGNREHAYENENEHIGLVARMSILDTEVEGSNPSSSMFSPWARDFIRISSVDSAVKWVPGGDNLVKGVQCYELFGGIALKNHAFSFFIFKCYSSEKLIRLNILHEAVPSWYSFHSWVDWSNADKVPCSRKQHTAAGVRTVYLCIQNRHSNQPTNMLNGLCLCLCLMATRLNSCKSPPKEISISLTYLLQSLLAMLKFPSNSLRSNWVSHYTVILQWMHISPILLGHATLNCVVWHLFLDSWHVLQLPHSYLLLFCREFATITHCCLVLLMMWHPTCNGCRTMQLV